MPLGHEAGRPHLTARCLVSRVAVFGDNEAAANPALAAETAAAEQRNCGSTAARRRLGRLGEYTSDSQRAQVVYH